ncbi:SulP family inorganic anion transporter [Haliangium sp.]|uniref:SulP family inorganic anion transporter n=1 Tax=Haliangium sp. TaxID=2663208 RepID=UPI003D131AB1
MSEASNTSNRSRESSVPRGDLAGFRRNWRPDLLSGFLVFLIALPLCLGIALAGGYPPIAGVFTAIVGGLITPFISNSELTIKGPAAGLIVIALGCITDFGGTGFGDGVWSAADQHAYQLALGVGVAAAVIQILFGTLRGGILGEFFPSSAVHGMLAAIGVIIMAKQIPVALGAEAGGGPLELLARIPDEIANANPVIALIGVLSLAIMFLWPYMPKRHLGKIPAPMVVVLVAVPLSLVFGLNSEAAHTYTFNGHEYEIGSKFLVNVPSNMFSAITLPDFSGLTQSTGWYWVMMFAVIGTLESLLSAKAVDLLDPHKRKTNLDRDNAGVGVGNLVSAFLGGQPMISEIVRSRANIDNGARTRFANLFHGLFLLVFVASVPALISLIPLSALGAMLVYTGFRLAHPREFFHVYKIGKEQLIVFMSTIVAVLATDLLKGIAIGIGIKVVLHLLNGAPLRSLFRPHIEVTERDDDTVVLEVKHSAVFTTWLGLKRRIDQSREKSVVIDLSSAKLVDHTVMEKLHEMQKAFEQGDCSLEISGLDHHRPMSAHPHSARRLVSGVGSQL